MACQSLIYTNLNANVYINKCLRPNLVPFIKEHYNDDNHIFWTGLAKAHYAEVTTKYLESQNITFVPMGDNPLNVPQARPIENFWANLVLKVYDKGWKAQTNTQLIRRIRNKLKDFDQKELQEFKKSFCRTYEGGPAKTP